MTVRRTIVVQGRLALRDARLGAARRRDHGLQVMTFEQLAVRLAGGFAGPVDDEALRITLIAVLPELALGELDGVKDLPGMVDAASNSLQKTWRAGIDLAARAYTNPRLKSLATLEAAVLARLPAGMMRPGDLAAAAMARCGHARAVLGDVEIVGLTELAPCWRPLLHALAGQVRVTLTSGPRATPEWLEASGVEIARSAPCAPATEAVSAATAYHEVVEALRWVRSLLAAGVPHGEIAIAAVSTADYDDPFLALRSDANLDLHFVHGIRATTTRDGQAAAALADILVRGLSRRRVLRLAALCDRETGPFASLPGGWRRMPPDDAPLSSLDAWTKWLDRVAPDAWPDKTDHRPTLLSVLTLLAQGHAPAKDIGEVVLSGLALALWRTALRSGPSSTIDRQVEALKLDDSSEASVSVAWMPASTLAASPRPYVRLIGLNSGRWPRRASEDRLIPDHIIPSTELDPIPLSAQDRRDFDTIRRTTASQLVFSRARRDSEGRLLGRSPLLPTELVETYLRRNDAPAHAFSETDRLLARPADFAAEPRAVSAAACWRNWHTSDVTAHDGVVSADHPIVRAALDRIQSASSLRLLLRNPLGFVWHYGLKLSAPEDGEAPLVLEPSDRGTLIHGLLEEAVAGLEAAGGLAHADEGRIRAAVADAARAVAQTWELERPVPPAVIWRRTLDEACAMAVTALTMGETPLADSHSFAEVAFGGKESKSKTAGPWDTAVQVSIPGAGFRISGYIDRLDVSSNGQRAHVCDYKTGKKPKGEPILDGGKELQRCLYAYAVKALLGPDVEITASLLYPRDRLELKLPDPEATLAEAATYLKAARESLAAGSAVVGPDAGDTYDDFALMLPANAGAVYCKRKAAAVKARLGDAATVWEAP